MDRRSFLALLSTPAVLALLQACSDGDGGSPTTTGAPSTSAGPTTTLAAGPWREARSNLARVSSDPALAPQAARAVNALGTDLYARLAAENPGNLVFSSASIMLALAMTRAGAAGGTATEMDRVLHADLVGTSPDALHPALNSLSAVLESRSGMFTVDEQQQQVELSIANSLWGQVDINWLTLFLDTLAVNYGAGMRLTDYRADAEAARTEINRWVGEATKQRIPDLLGPGTITADTALTLVNAIYMKAPWFHPFEDDATTTGPFATAASTTVQVPIMHTSRTMQYAAGDGWQMVELPYVGNALAMTLLVPDLGRLAEIEGLLPSGLFDTGVGALGPRDVTLGLPKFDIESRAQLSRLMAALGMPTAFDPNGADFSGITNDLQLFIDLIVHQANITVDEKGTEAAAATAVVMVPTAAPSEPPVTLEIDHPFLFAVRDVPTGAVLFLGRVTDPSV